MKIAKSDSESGMVKFQELSDGAVFRLNGVLWMRLNRYRKYALEADAQNATLLKDGNTTRFEVDRLVLPIEGAFVEGYTEEGD